jgi:hypothetical protein
LSLSPCPRVCYRQYMGDESKLQPDLFNDEFDRLRVFPIVGGAFIGRFNRQAAGSTEVAEGGTPDPVLRLSAYLPSEDAARSALASGVWPPPEPEG